MLRSVETQPSDSKICSLKTNRSSTTTERIARVARPQCRALFACCVSRCRCVKRALEATCASRLVPLTVVYLPISLESMHLSLRVCTLIRDITRPLFAVAFPIVLLLPVCVRVHGCNSVVAGLCEASAGLRLANLMGAVQFIVAGLRAGKRRE